MKHMLNTDFHVAISPLLPCDISIEFQSNVFSHSLAVSYSNIACENQLKGTCWNDTACFRPTLIELLLVTLVSLMPVCLI